MVSDKLNKEKWLEGALKLVRNSGIESVKIVQLAQQLGVTTGSFYWHFSNRKELYDAILQYWLKTMTDDVIEAAKIFQGTPQERIFHLMDSVMSNGMARCDMAIWHWAQSDEKANTVFQQALNQRFEFATWMFEEVGFSRHQAESRGEMMVYYMMGKSALASNNQKQCKNTLKLQFKILISR